ncbi:MAG: transglutaminase-like domain-containing protein [Spirochaetaceae bacterium]|jgi:hypothetical protein|nr:transglutaminase-like domain-containing protein [Spirochaetaceae bacterium]
MRLLLRHNDGTKLNNGLYYKVCLAARSMAAAILLFQIRLFLGEITDGAFFCIFLLQAFLVPFVLKSIKLKTLPALIVLALLPFAVRFFAATPRIIAHLIYTQNNDISVFIPFDTLLLQFDSNMFASLFPFYYLSITTFFALSSYNKIRYAACADIFLYILIFTVLGSGALSAYKWPILKLAVLCSILFFELIALSLSFLAEKIPRPLETAAACLAPLFIVILAGIMLFKPLSERSLEEGGGLLQRELFSFDFAPFLRLENEITMNDDLVFIVRKVDAQSTQSNSMEDFDLSELDTQEFDDEFQNESENNYNDFFSLFSAIDSARLTRRFILSAYDSKAGFTRDEVRDEAAQRRLLPREKTDYTVQGAQNRFPVEQEYYMVNIDGEAFLAMNEPAQSVPFEGWDASSFKSAFKVLSMVSGTTESELTNLTSSISTNDTLGLSAEDFAWYTAWSGKKPPTKTERQIQKLSEELTAGITNYYLKIQTLYNYLKYGDYVYSLKPGAAPDGDQLGYFLFTTKRGYCSYYAFAFASMLRSLGIPCRLAIGFYIDYESERFGFFPVLANMAHAWVEVWFPGYGWIEYDPTTTQLAPDEEWRFSAGPPTELLERLLKEILEKRSGLREKEGEPTKDEYNSSPRLNILKIIAASSALPLLLIAAVLARRYRWYIRFVLTKNLRKKCVYIYNHSLLLAKRKRRGGGNLADDILKSLYELAQKAKFAREYMRKDHKKTMELFENFILELRKR